MFQTKERNKAKSSIKVTHCIINIMQFHDILSHPFKKLSMCVKKKKKAQSRVGEEKLTMS